MRLCIASFVWCLISYAAVGVEGATDCKPALGSLTIKTAQDVSDVAKCSTFTGDIFVAADGPDEVILDGLKSILGNLDVENVGKLHSLSSMTLEAVSSLTLKNLPELSNLSFPVLKKFSSLKWDNLPALEGCSIATGPIETDIGEITISNTSMKSLDWLVWSVGQLVITDNAKLESFSLPYEEIHGALTFGQNAALKSFDVSRLIRIEGGLNISNNDVTTLSFAKLQVIQGNVKLGGGYTNISMPVLNSIGGSLDAESTGDISALCTNLEKDKSFVGHYECESKTSDTPQPSTSNPDATSGPDNESDPGEEDDEPGPSRSVDPRSIGIAAGVIVIAILAVIFSIFYFKRRIRSKVREISHDSRTKKSIELSDTDTSSVRSLRNAGVPMARTASVKELESPAIRLELASDSTVSLQELPGALLPHELDGRHGRSELGTPIAPLSPAPSFESVNSVTPLVRYEMPA
ncbi:hypothetical protein BDV95DRAFT_242640 [Massariosphaeria phaeospora]|uniref:Receptor L-domain domain-containing protein n=1 Tax=Massariosphaeria phaeospora TaxID=100035 RepID=A0A7C8I6V0_9PLEO|nr:hypothetical protein BDV95DRAFT_242640 [Massariosphaeria phaeospora]